MLTADVYIYNKKTLNVEKRSFNEMIGSFDSASQTSLWKRDYSWMTSSVILSVLVVGNIIDSNSEHLLPGFSLAFHILSLDNPKIEICLAMTCIWTTFWLAFIQYTCVVSYKGVCIRKKWRYWYLMKTTSMNAAKDVGKTFKKLSNVSRFERGEWNQNQSTQKTIQRLWKLLDILIFFPRKKFWKRKCSIQ